MTPTPAVQYLLGDLTPEEAGVERWATKIAAEKALAASGQVAVIAVEDGAAVATTARLTGVDRQGLLKWLGKK